MHRFSIKTALAIAVAGTLFSAPASSQTWSAVTPPVTNHFTGVDFTNDSTGYIVTSSGKLLVTTSTGRFWKVYPVSTQPPLEDLCFLNAQVGYVCGRQGMVFLTTDSGASWYDRSPADADTAYWFLSIHFWTADTGIVVGMTRDPQAPFRGIVYRTTDAGQNWQRVNNPGTGLGDITVLTDGTVLIPSFNGILRSTDRGTTWTTQPHNLERPGRALALSDSLGILVGNAAMAARSVDGGQSWKPIELSIEAHFVATQFVGGDTALITATGGTVFESVDGGASFARYSLPTSANLFDIALTSTAVWIVGSHGAIFVRPR